jgi:hypothetical protein
VFKLELNRIEEPRGKTRGIFDRKEFCLLLIRSLTPQQAAGNGLSIRFKGMTHEKIYSETLFTQAQ